MKKAVLLVSGFVLLASIVMASLTLYAYYNPRKPGATDKTTNINVMLNRPSGWKKIIEKNLIEKKDMYIIDGSTATIPITAEILRQFFNLTDEEVNMQEVVYHSTTHNAYLNLINKTARPIYLLEPIDESLKNDPVSLIFVTAPSEEEKQIAQNSNVVLDIEPIAKDGFVFITHKDNPVNNLSVEQIKKIYSGEITNWKDVGGDNLTIRAYQREQNSGSQTAMQKLVMNDTKLIKSIDTKIYLGMGDLVDAVAEFENGKASIGYTYYYYINNLYRNDNIKVLSINDISPANENLLNNKYPFSTNYFAVIRNDEPANSNARLMRDFLISKQGQELIEMAGYCRR